MSSPEQLFSPEIQEVIYLPAFNCEKALPLVVAELPQEMVNTAGFLIIDNASTDGTSNVAIELCKKNPLRGRVALLRAKKNLGYAGSQKLAFRICRENECIKSIIMLHADGQYPPSLLPEFRKALNAGADVAYGYREKNRFGEKEETPARVRFMIQLLNWMECTATHCHEVQEWHSGYVGYKTSFLNQVNLKAVTETRHIDGNMLFAASSLSASIQPIPIFKRYRHYEGFAGPAAYVYIVDCLRLMFSMPKTVSGIKNLSADDVVNWNSFEILSK